MIEIIPIDDLEPHKVGKHCGCSPNVITESGIDIIVHSAFDGRQLVEEANELLGNKNDTDEKWMVIDRGRFGVN